jgi:hypothetical protein
MRDPQGTNNVNTVRLAAREQGLSNSSTLGALDDVPVGVNGRYA